MERSLNRFIIRYSLRQQMVVIFMTLLSFPITYITLELPKRIVNEALGEKPGWARGILGANMEQVTFLLALCFAFLVFVLISGAQKYYLNVYAGRLGEQMLRRLRFQLYGRILRFPLPHFKKTSQGELIPMVIAETDPIGGYVGEAWSIPAYQGGTLIVYLVFIFVQDLWLGLAAISLYPAQLWLIPKLQAAEWNAAGTEAAVRSFADGAGLKLGAVAQPLRAALTGRTTSPGIFEVLAVLGKEESLARLGDQAV